ncbi:MAG: hypothetical protein R3253_01165 [Longimicrobiales bacterium]|nr:hypothetical protein [Longimicrobiales bacterium]
MSDGKQDPTDRFDAVDSNLTVFALANGIDLVKGEGHRRLEWFSEGLERGIVIEVRGDGAFDVTALTWRGRSPGRRSEAVVAEEVPAPGLRDTLAQAIDTANGLDAPVE